MPVSTGTLRASKRLRAGSIMSTHDDLMQTEACGPHARDALGISPRSHQA